MTRRARRVALALTLAGAVAACRGAPPPLPPIPEGSGSLLVPPGTPLSGSDRDDPGLIDRIVAVVNGEVILLSELQEALILYLRETREPTPPPTGMRELQQKVLGRIVNHRLQVQEARREKVEVTEEEVQSAVDDFVRRNGGDRTRIEEQLRAQGLAWEGVRRELRDQILVQKIRSRRVGRRATVTEVEVEAYVSENRAKLEADLKYRARHIAILARPADQPAAWERAKAEIDGLVTRLGEGVEFAELARAHSQDASAAAGGDVGWHKRGELQALFEAPILRLRKGEVTEPIRSSAGYHLFQLEDREELTRETLAQFRQQARDLLLQKKAQERFDEWVEELRRRALITVRL